MDKEKLLFLRDPQGRIAAIYLLFSGHRECFDLISNYSI
jgi:hypothetical protein